MLLWSALPLLALQCEYLVLPPCFHTVHLLRSQCFHVCVLRVFPSPTLRCFLVAEPLFSHGRCRIFGLPPLTLRPFFLCGFVFFVPVKAVSLLLCCSCFAVPLCPRRRCRIFVLCCRMGGVAVCAFVVDASWLPHCSPVSESLLSKGRVVLFFVCSGW